MIYAGIDLGGTSIKGALVTDKGQILRKKSIPAGAERSHRDVVTDMANLILDLMTEEGLTPEEHAERSALRNEYRADIRLNLQAQLDHTYLVDETGKKTRLRKKARPDSAT